MTNKSTSSPLGESQKAGKKNFFGTKLKSARILNSMKQDDVVAEMNKRGYAFTTSTVSKIETHGRSLYDHELISMLDIFDLSFSELLELKEVEEKEKKQ